MTTASSLHKRKTLCLIVVLIAFSAFTIDILDLREELFFTVFPGSGLDNNVTACILNNTIFGEEPIPFTYFLPSQSAFKVSLPNLLPYGLRAPPSRS